MRTVENTTLHTWFERARTHVELRDAESGETIVEWWDEDVSQAIEDGFLTNNAFILGKLVWPHRLHESAVEYANQLEV